MGAKLTPRATSCSRAGRAGWVVAGVCALLLGATELRAQTQTEAEPQAFRVVFSSSGVCSNPSEFVEQLQRRTRHLRPANAVEPALTFFVSLTSTQAGVQGNLRVQGVDGTGPSREVPGVDCHEVLSAMALIGALMVDPFALTGEELPPAPPQPGPSPEPSQPEPPPARQEWSLGAGQRINVNGGVLPGLGLGESVFVQASVPVSGPFHPGVRIAGHFARSVEETDLTPPLGTGEFEWRAVRLVLCPVLWSPLSALSLRPCVFVDAGQLFAAGAKAADPQEYYSFWAATGPELELEIALLGRLTLGAEVGWMFPLVRRDFFYFRPSALPQARVHQISSGLAAGLGLGLRFF